MDHEQDNVTSGLSKADTQFLIDIASHFTSRNKRNAPGLGNAAHEPSVLTAIVQGELDRHPDITHDLRKRWEDAIASDAKEPSEDASGVYEELCNQILNCPQEEYYRSQGLFCRVVQRVEVFYFAQPVECVTKEFRKFSKH